MSATTAKQTRAERLEAIRVKIGPNAKAPVIHTLQGTARKITIEDPDSGDRIGASGDTIDAAIDNLAAKVANR